MGKVEVAYRDVADDPYREIVGRFVVVLGLLRPYTRTRTFADKLRN